MNKILLLTDFSDASKHAIAFTQALFADVATEFCLLHTFALEPVESYGGISILVEERESAEKTMKVLMRSLIQQAVPAYHTYRTLVMLGDPVSSVEIVLAKEHFDLVVAGATGSGHNEWLGSVATGLVRSANTNVLVVPTSAPIRPLERLVLATDYRSVQDAESFSLLNELVAHKAAQLTLLTIENPMQPATKSSEMSRQYVLNALGNLSVDTYLIHDEEVRHGIAAYLATHRTDLLVLLPHHKGFLDAIFHRSVSRSVVYHPPVPVLSLYDNKAAEETPVNDKTDLDKLPFATYL